VSRNARFAQGTGERGPLEQDLQRRVRNERVSSAGERGEQRAQRERRDAPTPQRYPHRLEMVETVRARVAGEGDSVQRAS
jgi:hypothetical protein